MFRAEAGVLLVGDHGDNEPAGAEEVLLGDGAGGGEDRGDAALHVLGAAAV